MKVYIIGYRESYCDYYSEFVYLDLYKAKKKLKELGDWEKGEGDYYLETAIFMSKEDLEL